jgi:hypothetical protein
MKFNEQKLIMLENKYPSEVILDMGFYTEL